MARCDELAAFTEEPGRITRPYGTPALAAARDDGRASGCARRAWTSASMPSAICVADAEGSQPSAPALLLGSHLDSVRDAGRYDGPLGILDRHRSCRPFLRTERSPSPSRLK